MIRYDCRYYIGRKPCKFKRVCEGCPHVDPFDKRILIIKLGALGDLLRTMPLLKSLKEAYPHSQVTWITIPSAVPLLQNSPFIDQVWITDENISTRLLAQKFDLVLNFDKDTPAPELASLSQALAKKGFGVSPQSGALIALNAASEYALNLGLDDNLKFFKNQKTYQHIIHEMAELKVPSPMHSYGFALTDQEKNFSKNYFSTQSVQSGFLLGFNPGAGPVFATKRWILERYTELAVELYKRYKTIPVLFGGKTEVELNNEFAQRLKAQGVSYLRPGENHSLREFASLLSHCHGVITGDTLAMHLSLSLNIPTLVLFTSTCAQEIEMYGVGDYLVGKAPCAPCFLSKCFQPSQICAESISVATVFEKAAKHFKLYAS